MDTFRRYSKLREECPGDDRGSPEKQLLEEIREESRRSEEVTRRIVEAIVSGGR
eukprot:gene26040-32569_t